MNAGEPDNEPKLLFSYGGNPTPGPVLSTTAAPIQNATPVTILDTENLASAMTTENNIACSQCQNNCYWWKARSRECAKCQVQELVKRPKPTTGGYGPIPRREVREEDGSQNDRSGILKRKNPKNTKGGNKQDDDDDEEDEEETSGKRGRRGHSLGRDRGKECEPLKSKYYISETQDQFRPPHLQRKGTSTRKTEKKEETIRKMKEFMRVRPPWDITTRLTEPPYIDSLGASESKARELESIVENEMGKTGPGPNSKSK